MRAIFAALCAALLFATQSLADLVLGGQFSPSALACEQIGATQTFASDPLGTTWTAYTSDADCPIVHDAGTGSLERERTTNPCDQSRAVARFDTNLGESDGCARIQVTENTDGSTGTPWRTPGLLFASGSGDLSSISYLTVRCQDGLPCTDFRIADELDSSQICGDFGAVAIGDYIGVCWEDTGLPADSLYRVEAFNLGASPPASPLDWGTPACVWTGCVWGACLAATPGQYAGVAMGAETPGSGSVTRVDNFAAYRGCEDAGGDTGGGSLNSWEAGNTWSTGNTWE